MSKAEINEIAINKAEQIKELFEKVFNQDFSDMALQSIYFDYGEGIANDCRNYFKTLPEDELNYFRNNPKKFNDSIKELEDFVDTCEDLLKNIKGKSIRICSYDFTKKRFSIK